MNQKGKLVLKLNTTIGAKEFDNGKTSKMTYALLIAINYTKITSLAY